MDPITLIAVVAVAILLVWISSRVPYPGNLILVAVVAIVLLLLFLRLLGMY